MTDKKVLQLVSGAAKSSEKITPEFRKVLDEMYSEILSGKPEFVMVVADPEGGVSYMTNLDAAGCNLILDQIKFEILYGSAE